MQIFVVFSPDNFLTRTLSSEEGGVSRLVLRLMSAAENLPSHAAEMMRNALPDQLLQLQTLWLGTLRVIGPWLVHPPSHLDVAGLPLVPVLEDVAPCEPEVTLPASTGFSALLTAACISVKCLAVGKCHWSCLVTWLHRNLRGDARSSWVARSRLRFSSRHTETAERLGVALNQSDIRHTSYHQSFQTDNLQTQPVCFLELLEQLELGHGELLCVRLLAVAGLNRCLGDCLGSSSSLTFLIRILLLPRGFWSRVLYAAGIAVLLTSEMFVLFWELNITNPHSEFAESFYNYNKLFCTKWSNIQMFREKINSSQSALVVGKYVKIS